MGGEGGPQFNEVPIGEYAGLGGRALTSAIVSKEVPATCHALGSENKLVIAPGMLSGTIAAIDSTGMCLFIAFAILDQPETFQALVDIIGAYTGTDFTADGITELGKKVLTMEPDFNARAGFTKAHDRLPDYFKTEALPPHNVTFGVTDEELDKVFDW